MFQLGKAPLGALIWTSIPILLALITFSVGFLFFTEPRTTYWTTFWVLAVCADALYLAKRPYGSFAHASVAILIFLRYVETFDPSFLGTWLALSFVLAYMTATAAVSKDASANTYARFFFEFMGYQGFFWSLHLLLLVYTPSSYLISFGPTVLGICATLGVLDWWALKANHMLKHPKSQKGA